MMSLTYKTLAIIYDFDLQTFNFYNLILICRHYVIKIWIIPSFKS